ncbi:hypothetical protein CC78DRAFT_97951 [Lojkania enalia]|uniref:Uncharacterized protein n=1 Tax=Lojkania enalia TaxID=147567 RepID=A0A9P4N1I3_9PLEO|nr:hypothetical protein CC78DRAFT_97951 [Didymosphaeria enalia]
MQQPPSTRTFMAPHQASHPVPQDQEIRPSTPASLSNMANFDPDRIFRWCHTATTIDQSLLLSPLTPRPFTDAELGFKYMDRSTSSSSLEMPYRVSDTHSPQEGPEKLYPIGPPTPMGSMDAPAFVPLAAMYRAQEQVRCGVDLPPLMVPEVYREGGKVVGGPRLIASGLEKIDGDLIKVCLLFQNTVPLVGYMIE